MYKNKKKKIKPERRKALANAVKVTTALCTWTSATHCSRMLKLMAVNSYRQRGLISF